MSTEQVGEVEPEGGVTLRQRPLTHEDAAALGRFMRALYPEILPLIAKAKVAFAPHEPERRRYERFLEDAGLSHD